MKKNILICSLSFLLLVIFCNFQSSSGFKDDRMVDCPFQDSILEELVSTCRQQSDANKNSDKEYNDYYMTLNYFIQNDTTKVWVMGSYFRPFVFHNKYRGIERFIGYFKRNNTYCFVYKDAFEKMHNDSIIKEMQNIVIGWRLREIYENPEFFPIEMPEQDPYIFEYIIDVNETYKLENKGMF